MQPKAFTVCALAGVFILALGQAVRAQEPQPTLKDLGPRLVSNQTPQPLVIYGEKLSSRLKLHLGPPISREYPLTVLDGVHAYARLGGLSLPTDVVQALVSAVLWGADGKPVGREVKLTVINDSAFIDLTRMALSPGGQWAFVLSPNTDRVYAVRVATGRVISIPVGDGPSALAPFKDATGGEWMAVTHAFSPELRLLRISDSAVEQRTVPAPPYATNIVIEPNSRIAYVAEHARSTVSALKLDENGRELWRTRVRPGPRAMALIPSRGTLVVGSLQTGELEFLQLETGKILNRVQPGHLQIVGGRTERYSQYVMDGKAPRGLIYSKALDRLFVTSIGPNIGPNPDRMEVSMNGGVSVVRAHSPAFLRHVGFGAGIPESMALDERRRLLYVADIGVGKIRILDARTLVQGEPRPNRQKPFARIQDLAIPPPKGFPLVRPANDFGIQHRAGVEMHSGPRELALSTDGRTLFVLNRFTGTLGVVDVTYAQEGRARFVTQWPIAEMLNQPMRRMGQVDYYTDLGQTGMSCDACHLEGHTEGVFFAKTRPLRIYRSPSLRAARETPPYFIPTSTSNLAQTAKDVGGRNRFHNPDLTPSEIDQLTAFTATLALLPNPFVGADGAPVEQLALPEPGDHVGHPRRGMRIFEDQGCTECHPPPHFTTDQNVDIRGRMMNVGTPRALPLRPQMQDLMVSAFPPPSLLGAWDIFPMWTSGAAGIGVGAQGQLQINQPFALRAAALGPSSHGNAAKLSPQQQDDLLAFLLSL